MKKNITLIGIILLSTLLSFTNLQAELRWKHVSKLDDDVRILDAKSFNGKMYVLYLNHQKHKIAVSEDKGNTWKKLHSSDKIAFISKGYAGEIIDEKNIVYFMNDKFMRSSDGGANWDSIPFNGKHNNETAIASKVEIFHISMGDSLNGIAPGRYNKKLALFKTNDGWKNVEIINRSFHEIAEGISDSVNFNIYKMVSKDTIIKVGNYFPNDEDIKTAIAYSFDGGKTYTKFYGINEEFATVRGNTQVEPLKKTKAGFWVLVGGRLIPETKQNGRVYKCNKIGDKWEEIFYNDDNCHIIMNCDFYDESTGIVNTSFVRYRPYRTYDGGKTWKTDTLITNEGVYPGNGDISSHNYVCYVDDTPVLISASSSGEVFRLEEVKSIEYDVDTLQQVRIVAKGDNFMKKQLKFKAFANKEDIDECWIDLNNNKKREENENLKVYRPQFLSEENIILVPMKGVTIYGKFLELRFLESDIEELNVSKCPSLTKLTIGSNPLKSTDVHLCKNIDYLFLNECSELKSLDVSKCNKLKALVLKDCPLIELYISEDNNLGRMEIEKSKLKEVDISMFKDGALVTLNDNPKLKKIITGNNCNVDMLQLSEPSEDLNSIDFSGLKKATIININETNLDEVDLSECKSLTGTEIRNNPNLIKLKLPENETLKNVGIHENQISELIFKANKELTIFKCHKNGGIKSLNFNGSENLVLVDCFLNKITGDEADKLMESLPDRTGKEPEGRIRFTAYNSEGKYKVGNWAYAYSVEKAKAKNWSIQYYPQGDYKGTSSVSEGTLKVFNIYPNPADNVLNIPEYETLITDIEIYNTSLDQVKTLTPAAKIDISELPAGVYYIKLNFVMHKFVKK